jgi:hypothetical protein
MSRYPTEPIPAASSRVELEETLVPDVRGALTPAEMVDRKLLALLPSGPQQPPPRRPPAVQTERIVARAGRSAYHGTGR